jgi:hypothetical protein
VYIYISDLWLLVTALIPSLFLMDSIFLVYLMLVFSYNSAKRGLIVQAFECGIWLSLVLDWLGVTWPFWHGWMAVLLLAWPDSGLVCLPRGGRIGRSGDQLLTSLSGAGSGGGWQDKGEEGDGLATLEPASSRETAAEPSGGLSCCYYVGVVYLLGQQHLPL